MYVFRFLYVNDGRNSREVTDRRGHCPSQCWTRMGIHSFLSCRNLCVPTTHSFFSYSDLVNCFLIFPNVYAKREKYFPWTTFWEMTSCSKLFAQTIHIKNLMGPKGLTLVKRGDKFLLHSLSHLTGPQISLPILSRMFSCLHHHKASFFFYRSNTLHSPLQCMWAYKHLK